MYHTIIIAEAGVNHNGDIEKAKKLISVAAQSGADYVKFQTFKAEKLVTRLAEMADYQKANIDDTSTTQFDMLKNLEMPDEWYLELIEHANEKGIKFLSTGFDEESVDFLDSLNLDLFKVPSGEITNRPFLEHIAKKGKKLIISTGMSNLEEIKEAISVIESNGIDKKQIIVLHCNTEYPTPFVDVNLHAMNTIKTELGVNVGYSDHTLGIEVSIAAVALGAKVIEKHFTLDKNMKGPDHIASLSPDELYDMVSAIRNIELAIAGNGRKTASKSEEKNIRNARKSIHIGRDIKAGKIIEREDLKMKRPGDGISPMKINEIIGKKTTCDLFVDHQLQLKDIEF